MTEDDRADLGESGRRLWTLLTGGGQLAPLQSVLALEACRIADRLDRLHGQLAGGAWTEIRADDDSATDLTVVINAPLAEARQQAVALKQLVAELRQGGARGAGGAKGKGAGGKEGAGGVLADISKRLAERRPRAAG